jgi:hypothetical protein
MRSLTHGGLRLELDPEAGALQLRDVDTINHQVKLVGFSNNANYQLYDPARKRMI